MPHHRTFHRLLALPLAAPAHVTLETRSAEAGSHYKAVLRVGHGCDGSPMRELAVQIPAGVRAARPMLKPGWRIDIEQPGKLYWKVSQVCEPGRIDWDQVPAPGQTPRELESPAARLEALPNAQARPCALNESTP